MKLESVLPNLREGSIIYRGSLSGIDRTYYQYDGREVKCFYKSLKGSRHYYPFNFSKADLLAEDWTIMTTLEENKLQEELNHD